jgi:hypothetical protein
MINVVVLNAVLTIDNDTLSILVHIITYTMSIIIRTRGNRKD